MTEPQNSGRTRQIQYSPPPFFQSGAINIRQNHWSMKYRSQWPMFILRSNIRSYWHIIPKYDVYISNSLQDISGKNTGPWNIGNVTRLTEVPPTICLSCFHNRKVEKHFLKVSKILTSYPTPGHGLWGQASWNESQPYRVSMVQIWMLSDEWLSRYELLNMTTSRWRSTQIDLSINQWNGCFQNRDW